MASVPLVAVAALALLILLPLCVHAADVPGPAPRDLPSVTVRWEDPGQAEVFVVEGAHYQCRIATRPARIMSLRVDGEDLLGPAGMDLRIQDAAGHSFHPAPADFTPSWEVWRRRWVPATDSRARMNVWSAGPYYWDAHLLEIPFIADDALRAAQGGEPLLQWSFDDGLQGWQALNSSTVTAAQGAMRIEMAGPDPYVQGPPVDLPNPLAVVIRLRTDVGGGAAFYWREGSERGYSGAHVTTFNIRGDGEWHDYRVILKGADRIKQIRFDPPGELGTCEVDSIRFLAIPAPDPNLPGPVRGEMIFHAYPDQLRVEARFDVPEGQAAITRIHVKPDAAAEETRLSGHPVAVLRGKTASAAVLLRLGGAPEDGLWNAAPEGRRPGCVWVLRPLASQETLEAAFAAELTPLPLDAVQVTGGQWLGYDAASGLYLMRADANVGAFSFEESYQNPSRRVQTAVRITNPGGPRSMLVKCLTGIGCLEAAALTDLHGFPLGVPVQVCKNFAGELEEPDDSAFGDSYFPLALAAGESREFQILHMNQNWGTKPLKQISSIRFFNIYWHLSTGVSETTCFTHNWMQIGRSGILHIPDFRPMSGELWAGQPQHDCQQWPGFLQYNNGAGKLVFERTIFDSISPCLARYTNLYHTSDGAATGRLEVFEAPQRDEMRTFVRLRYDWTRPVQIEGDARINFRWLNLFEKKLPAQLLWVNAGDETQAAPVRYADAPMLLGEPLSRLSPFVASSSVGDNYSCLVLIRSFRAQLGGKPLDQPAVSAQFGRSDGTWWLTVPQESLQIQPGDFVEADVMLMPHGEPTPPELKPTRERRERFGMGLPRVTDVKVGSKIADFPAEVRAQDDAAQFTVTGGYDLMPLIVDGFAGRGVPLLWRGTHWQDQQLWGGDGYQVDPDGHGGWRFTFVYPIRKGQSLAFTVTRVECTAGISALRDVNGRLVVQAPSVGTFRLKAPVFFAPGRNTLDPLTGLVTFEGTARSIQQVPFDPGTLGPRISVTLDAAGRPSAD